MKNKWRSFHKKLLITAGGNEGGKEISYEKKISFRMLF
jgi:hypothetical protein